MNLRGIIAIIRPINCSMIGIAVIAGIFVSKPPTIYPLHLMLGFLTGFFICAYSMITNDYYDIEVDRINQPSRPIPSGMVHPSSAVSLAILALALGLAASVLTLNLTAVIIASIYALLSWYYNASAKKSGLIGNAIVASSLAIPFIYGGVISGGGLNSLLLSMALTSLFAGIGREVIKAMADTEGDKVRGISSVPIRYGMQFAASIGAFFYFLAVIMSWVPIIFGVANELYKLGVLIPDLIFIYLSLLILKRPDAMSAIFVKRIALIGMLLGLIVFIGGAT